MNDLTHQNKIEFKLRITRFATMIYIIKGNAINVK
jgi:hypothetical protein